MVNFRKTGSGVSDVFSKTSSDISKIRRLKPKKVQSQTKKLFKRMGKKYDPKMPPSTQKLYLEMDAAAKAAGIKDFDPEKAINLDLARNVKAAEDSAEKAKLLLDVIEENPSKFSSKAVEAAKTIKAKIAATGSIGVATVIGGTVVAVMAITGTSPKDLIEWGGEELGEILGTLTKELLSIAKDVGEPVAKGFGDLIWSFMSSVGWILIPILGIGIIIAIFYFMR